MLNRTKKIKFLKWLLFLVAVMLALVICLVFIDQYAAYNPSYPSNITASELTFSIAFGLAAGFFTVCPIWLPALIPNKYQKANLFFLWLLYFCLCLAFFSPLFVLFHEKKYPELSDLIMLSICIVLTFITLRLVKLFSVHGIKPI